MKKKISFQYWSKVFGALLLLVSSTSYAAIFNVTPASGGNCAVDPNACTLQEALIEASKNQQADTINLAAGTYDSSQNLNNNIPIPFSYTAHVGPDENFPLEIVGSADGNTIITGSSIQQGMSIITAALSDDAAADISIRNIRFENTVGNVFLSKDADFNLEQNVFEKNRQGVSITTETGALNIIANTIQNEQVVDGYIGLQLKTTNSILQINDNVVLNNQGSLNSLSMAFSSVNGMMTFQGNNFQANKLGGLIYFTEANADLKALDNRFLDNDLGSLGVAYFVVTDKAIEFSRNTVLRNSATGDSVVSTQSNTGNLLADRNYFAGNSAGAAWFARSQEAKARITNNLLSGNTSFFGALALGTETGILELIHNTIAKNNEGAGNGVYLLSLKDTATVRLYNNIVVDNFSVDPGADILLLDDQENNNVGASIELSHNIFSLLKNACVDPCVPNITQTNNLEGVDPFFIDPENGDFHLGANSPAIGAGDVNAPFLPEVDLDGILRSSPPDIGAYQAVPNILLDPVSIDFADVKAETLDSRLLTLTNQGAVDLDISKMTLDDTTNYALDLHQGDQPCASEEVTLAAGESCSLGVIFQPQSAGVFDAKLSIHSNDPDSPSAIVDLSGVGIDGSGGGGGCSLAARAHAQACFIWSLPLLLSLALRKIKRI